MLPREKIIRNCDRVIKFSLCVVAFYIPVSIALIESFAGLAIFAWLVKKIFAKEGLKKFLCSNILGLPVLLYLLACLASAILSSNPAISFRHLFFKTIEYLLLFFITVEICDAKFLRNILVVLVVSAGLVGIDGIFQFFTNVDFFRGRTPVIAGRINGPFTVPTDFASYVVTLLPLAASFAFLKFKRLWIKPTLVSISLILFVCLVMAVTRAAWVSLLLAIPLAAILGNRKLSIVVLLLVVLLVSFFPLMTDTAEMRLKDLFNRNMPRIFFERPLLWETGYNMFIEAPILGQGLGTFMYNFNEFKPNTDNYPYHFGISYAHNCFLQIASETGLLGLSSFILIIAVLFFSSFGLLNKIRGNNYHFILSGLLIGISTYLITSFFDTNLYSVPLAVLFWLMVGLAAGAVKVIKQEVL